MADETTRQVSERYARALATGEQVCCPTSYNFEDLRRFVLEEVLGASYGCGTPFVEADDDDHHTYRRGMPLEICSKTLGVLESGPCTRRFAVINRAGEPVAGEAVGCGLGRSC